MEYVFYQIFRAFLQHAQSFKSSREVVPKIKSSKQFVYDIAIDIGEAEVASLGFVGQARMVDAHQM